MALLDKKSDLQNSSSMANAPFTSINDKLIYTNLLENALKSLSDFETETTTRYSMFYSKDFGKEVQPNASNYRIMFQDPKTLENARIDFDGVPFIVVGKRVYDCENGIDRHVKDKEKYKAAQHEGDHVFKKNRFLIQPTKKVACPAKIVMREILRYSEFQIDKDTERKRKTASCQLKRAITGGTAKAERRFYVEFPGANEHVHKINQVNGLRQTIDKRLVSKIYELVGEGVRSVAEMRRHLKHFVNKDLFQGNEQPDKTNRRFYPAKVAVRNHMYNALIQQRYSNIDQENLEEKVCHWKKENPHDKFLFRRYMECSLDPSSKCVENAEVPEDDSCLPECDFLSFLQHSLCFSSRSPIFIISRFHI